MNHQNDGYILEVWEKVNEIARSLEHEQSMLDVMKLSTSLAGNFLRLSVLQQI